MTADTTKQVTIDDFDHKQKLRFNKLQKRLRREGWSGDRGV